MTKEEIKQVAHEYAVQTYGSHSETYHEAVAADFIAGAEFMQSTHIDRLGVDAAEIIERFKN